MRTIETTFQTFGASLLLIGLKGESNATEILIDCADALEEYQGTMAAMSITGPDGTVYPGDISLDEDGVVHWVVAERDCGIDGHGSARVDLVDDNGTVVASAEADTMVIKTKMQNIAPDQIENWTDAASVALQEVRAALVDLINTDSAATANEAARQLAETGRVSAETLRASAETARASAETARATAETARASAETARATAESERSRAETIRIVAENERVSEFSTMQANAQAALSYIGPSEASSTASAAHAAGSYFIYNGKLYQATDDIAIGDTITSGTNCAQVPGGAMGEVSNLKSAFDVVEDAVLAKPNFQFGFYTNNGETLGSFTSNTGYRSCIINVSEGEIYRIYGKGTNAARLWSTHSADGTTVRVAESSVDAHSTPVDVTIAPGETLLCFNSSNTYNPNIYYIGGTSFIQNTRQSERETAKAIPVIQNALFSNPKLKNGFYTNNEGTLGDFTENSNYRSALLEVAEGETYRIYGKGTNAALLWSTHSADGTTKRTGDADNHSSSPVEITIASDEVTLCFNSSNSYHHNVAYVGGTNAMQNTRNTLKSESKITESIINNVLQVETPNIFDGNFPDSGYFDENGADASSSTFKRTDYIPITNGERTLYVYRTYQPYKLEYCFYDSSKNAVGVRNTVFMGVSTDTRKTISIPSGTAYIRMYTHKTNYQQSLMLSYDYYSVFVPYGEPYYKIKEKSITEKSLSDGIVSRLVPLSGKTIVFMGDSIIGNFYDETGICAIMQSITGGNYINCAFGGTRMGYRHGNTSGQIAEFARWNTLSGAGLADAIASGDWSAQEAAIPAMTSWKPDYFEDRLDVIEAVDWSEVDYIFWEYGTNDFASNVALENQNDPTDMYAYANAYRKTIETILTAYPNIRIITITPFWRFWTDESDQYLYDSNEHEIADYQGVNHKLTDFVAKAMSVSKEYQIACIDNYYTTCANEYTRLSFFNASDGTHPNADGRRRIAVHLAAQIMAIT